MPVGSVFGENGMLNEGGGVQCVYRDRIFSSSDLCIVFRNVLLCLLSAIVVYKYFYMQMSDPPFDKTDIFRNFYIYNYMAEGGRP